MTLKINPETRDLVMIVRRLGKHWVEGDDGLFYVACPHCGFINCAEDPEVVRWVKERGEG